MNTAHDEELVSSTQRAGRLSFNDRKYYYFSKKKEGEEERENPNQHITKDQQTQVIHTTSICTTILSLHHLPDSHSINPKGSIDGTTRVVRGGSFRNDPSYLTVFNRGGFYPGQRYDSLGFRLARTERKY